MNKVPDTIEIVKTGPVAFGAAAVAAPYETESTAGEGDNDSGFEAGVRHAAAGHPVEQSRDVRGRSGGLPDPSVHRAGGMG